MNDERTDHGSARDDLLLRALRDSVDDVDHRLLRLLHERARLVARIGTRKRALGLPAVDRAREAAMAALHARSDAKGLSPGELRRLVAVARRVFRGIASRTAAP
ncbi:MAG: chorismate mutase [Planctomycetota bacterium]